MTLPVDHIADTGPSEVHTDLILLVAVRTGCVEVSARCLSMDMEGEVNLSAMVEEEAALATVPVVMTLWNLEVEDL